MTAFAPPEPADIQAAVETALAEDIGQGDVTTRTTVPAGHVMTFDMNTRDDIVVCGIPVALEVLARLAPEAKIEVFAQDGQWAPKGTHLMRLTGTAQGLLSAERTALNFLQKLSGIATLTRRFVDESGWLHQDLAQLADRVTLVVAGLPHQLKPANIS